MVATLRELFAKARRPSQDDKERAVHVLASIIEQAKAIGHAHASQEEERATAWGGKFQHALSSAWNIVNNFVQRIADWFAGQDEVTEEDVEAEVDSLAERVASYEVATAIEEQVLETLYFAGVTMVQSIAQPGACQPCQDKADDGPKPINDFDPPPYHGGCRCSAAPADNVRVIRSVQRLINKQGTCNCETCRSMAGMPVDENGPPFHDGCDCTTEEE
jgi:hypothetical protein